MGRDPRRPRALFEQPGLSWAGVADKLGIALVRYVDFIEHRIDVDRVGAGFGLDLHSEVALSRKVGGSIFQTSMTADERDKINELTVHGRRLFGYDE